MLLHISRHLRKVRHSFDAIKRSQDFEFSKFVFPLFVSDLTLCGHFVLMLPHSEGTDDIKHCITNPLGSQVADPTKRRIAASAFCYKKHE